MSFVIDFTEVAEQDILLFKKAGNRKVLEKIDVLLNELREHPESGTGKPEKLKHFSSPTWSRRINSQHRLVYQIQKDKILVLVLSLYGHYDDK